ncbi:hematopoietic prostaglandin D synthase-like [Oscarella lobularis]|uniref:hematopoietic prostaglandin D synthase-like n=1 Tax=Oscarella lobularis TaxID=121494 RepID=UPI003313E361
MAARIVLRYLQCQGRAEPLRLLLTDSGMPFKDERVQPEECKLAETSKWGPFRSLPVLEWDSYLIAQTEAIALYLATKLDYAGDGSAEQTAHSAALVSAAYQDLIQVAVKVLCTPVRGLERAFHEIAHVVAPRLQNLENYLGEKSFFIAGNKPCAGDFFVYVAVDMLMTIFGEEMFGSFPGLTAFHWRMEKRPSVKAYVDSGKRTKRLCCCRKEDEVVERVKGFRAHMRL